MSVEKEKKDSQQELIKLVTEYLDESKSLFTKELEVRFGTRGIKRTTKIDYDNVIEVLISKGFNCVNTGGAYALRVQNEFLDSKSYLILNFKLQFVPSGSKFVLTEYKLFLKPLSP